MKKLLQYGLLLCTTGIMACGGGEWWSGMSFYNIFLQTNVSSEYHPFLRDPDHTFFREIQGYNEKEISYRAGNIALWKKLLKDWSDQEIEKAIYDTAPFNWSSKNTKIEKSAQAYINFAKECSQLFHYRTQIDLWDYNSIKKQVIVDHTSLLSKANTLLKNESNSQLKSRYYYQIIRVLHYTKNWQEAIDFFESKVENKMPKTELYYYILDQVAGCYYSTKNYEKAAYLFTKVVSNSIDRKESAFLSFNFCAHKGAEGKSFFKDAEDQKNLLLIKSLRDFSNEMDNLQKFISLDANDNRVELLFMRALNNVERDIWPKNIGIGDRILPYSKGNNNYKPLLEITKKQLQNPAVKNKDYWRLATSYLSFIKQDLKTAKQQLEGVKKYKEQKKTLAIIYEIFSWETVKPANEDYIYEALKTLPQQTNWQQAPKNDQRNFILDKVAHIYYKNQEIAKAFLVHNNLYNVSSIVSLELLNSLEAFYKKPTKNKFEKTLLNNANYKGNFLEYLEYQKALYYLQHKSPEKALVHLNKIKLRKEEPFIPNTVFSNNIKECFRCPVSEIMVDEVYKASVFSFIKTTSNLKEFTLNLIALEKLTKDNKKWVAKLANYLLGNYYFNISNTGYFRGILYNGDNCCDYDYISYNNDTYSNKNETAKSIINKTGYNLKNADYNPTLYFELSKTAKKYYQKTMALSTDNELNARCLYLMAKCELNVTYNEGNSNAKEIELNKYFSFEIPENSSFKTLNNEYSNTNFYKMIIKECSYFKTYSASN